MSLNGLRKLVFGSVIHAIYSLNISACNTFQTDNFAKYGGKKNNTSKKKWPKKVYDRLNSLSVWRKKQKHLCTVRLIQLLGMW